MSRADKFLWSVRLFKSRSDASDGCKSGKVKINEMVVKSSKEVRVGDIVELRRGSIYYKYRVLALPRSREGAKNVPNYIEDITPEEELAKIQIAKEGFHFSRERGSGRPTKKERRDLDSLLENL